jgi:hypothetical protein
MPRAKDAPALVAGAEAPAADDAAQASTTRLRVLRQFLVAGEVQEVGSIVVLPRPLARELIGAAKAQAAPEDAADDAA